ncbi:MAG: hypothetical protein PHP85_12455 [Gallionella sp.]|nr:hypothetical protein [Gallionella sp.]
MRILLISLLLALAFSAEAYDLEIIELRHRSAGELIPTIRPLLDRDEMVSGMNYQLILRASPRSIEQIRRLLDSIDTMPRRLKITVLQDVDSVTVSRLTEVSGSVGLGRNARLTLPGTVRMVPGQDSLNARIESRQSFEDDKKTQQLQVLEGNRALVRTGQTVAVPERQVVQSAWGTQVIDSTAYRDVASGFYVLPRINGDRVVLEISAQNDALPPNQNPYPGGGYPAVRIQNTTSTVSGRLGEWIVLGGMGEQRSTGNSTFTSSNTARTNEQRNVLIKVDEVN